MAVVIGNNSGFCTVAPSSAPSGGTSSTVDNNAITTKDTSPATAIKVTEVGWYANVPTEAANFEVAIYTDDSGVPDDIVEVSRTNAKGTDAGWKRVTGLNWTISPSTDYWLGVQCDDTDTATFCDREVSGGDGRDWKSGQSTLPDPFDGGALSDPDGMYAVYAIWEAAASGTNAQINIGDSWKEIAAMKINIGDNWKDVAGLQINIGDTWKTVF